MRFAESFFRGFTMGGLFFHERPGRPTQVFEDELPEGQFMLFASPEEAEEAARMRYVDPRDRRVITEQGYSEPQGTYEPYLPQVR